MVAEADVRLQARARQEDGTLKVPQLPAEPPAGECLCGEKMRGEAERARLVLERIGAE